MEFSAYKALIRKEHDTQLRLLLGLHSLNPPKEQINLVEKSLPRRVYLTRGEFDLISKDTLDDRTIVSSAYEEIRAASLVLLLVQAKILSIGIKKGLKAYIVDFKKFRNLPVVNYQAKSAYEVRKRVRNCLQPMLKISQIEDLSSIPTSEWEALVAGSETSLASIKNLSIELSKSRADWNKYHDDTKRLRFAGWSMIISSLSLMLSQIPSIYGSIYGDRNAFYKMICNISSNGAEKCKGMQ